MKSVLEILKQGKERVTKGWCQGVLTRTADGVGVHGTHPLAVRWCATGALNTPLGGDFRDNEITAYLFLEERILGGRSVILWNNDPKRTQEEVINLFDRAINVWEMRGVSAT